jgi:hypothetical protein
MAELSGFYLYHLLDYEIEKDDKIINVRICRTLEIMKDIELPIFSKKRKKYGNFNYIKAIDILRYYTRSANFPNLCQSKKLKYFIKMFNYIFIFISDMIKYLPRYVICVYQSAIRLRGDLIISLKNFEKDDNKKLKKIAKCIMTKIINAVQSICIDYPNFLIRLPYDCFSTVTDYDIFKVFAEYDGSLLDMQTAHDLNNRFKIYKMDIIIAFIQMKKLNIHIILYILEYFLFKKIEYRDINISNSNQVFISRDKITIVI